MSPARETLIGLALVGACALEACNGLLGNQDAVAIPDDGGDGSTSDGSSPADATLRDGPGADGALGDGGAFDAGSCDGSPQSDPRNCGVCGHGCLGGACVAGACQPVVVGTGPGGPAAIAVDSTALYWSTFAGASWEIRKCPLDSLPCDGGIVVTMARQPDQLAALGGTVFWADKTDRAVEHCDPSGCGVLGGTPGGFKPSGVALDGTNVYTGTGVGILACPTTGCDGGMMGYVVQTSGSPYRLVVAGSAVYWTDWAGNQILGCLASGCATPLPIAVSVGPAQQIASDGTNVYWADIGDSGPGAGSISGCAPASCTPMVFAPARSYPKAVAVHGGQLYWTDDVPDGSVSTVSLSGGSIVDLATGQSYPFDLAVDDRAVYWANGDGTLVLLAK